MRQIDATFKPILAFLRHTYFKSKVTISVKMVLLELVHITLSKNASNAMLKKITESVTDDLILSQIGENLENKYYEECFTN